MPVLQDFDVLDLDRTCDLDNSLIEEAVEVELLGCEPAQIDDNPHVAAELVDDLQSRL
jgi:hypothetical protein